MLDGDGKCRRDALRSIYLLVETSLLGKVSCETNTSLHEVNGANIIGMTSISRVGG